MKYGRDGEKWRKSILRIRFDQGIKLSSDVDREEKEQE